jgi:hypothetical protein
MSLASPGEGKKEGKGSGRGREGEGRGEREDPVVVVEEEEAGRNFLNIFTCARCLQSIVIWLLHVLGVGHGQHFRRFYKLRSAAVQGESLRGVGVDEGLSKVSDADAEVGFITCLVVDFFVPGRGSEEQKEEEEEEEEKEKEEEEEERRRRRKRRKRRRRRRREEREEEGGGWSREEGGRKEKRGHT